MNQKIILDYLSALERNNSREWFHANKAQYQEAALAFEDLVDALLHQLRQIDSSIPLIEPKKLTFKLQRDTRFSHDKSPYNPCFRAHISSKGKLPIPVGYYIMLMPNERSFLGGGLFADMFKDATTMVRDYICAHGDAWQQIISSPDFKEHFTIRGTALKKMPPGYSHAHPQAEYIRHKSWFIEFPVSDKRVTEDGFATFAVDIFAKMRGFHSFLNHALEGFEMPAR